MTTTESSKISRANFTLCKFPLKMNVEELIALFVQKIKYLKFKKIFSLLSSENRKYNSDCDFSFNKHVKTKRKIYLLLAMTLLEGL